MAEDTSAENDEQAPSQQSPKGGEKGYFRGRSKTSKALRFLAAPTLPILNDIKALVQGKLSEHLNADGRLQKKLTAVGWISFFLFLPFRVVGAILKSTFALIQMGFAWIVLAVLLVGTITFFLMGGAQVIAKWANDVGVAPAITKSVTLVTAFFKDPSGVIGGRYGTFTNPDVIEEKPKKGVEFISTTSSRLYYTNHKIDIAGRVKIDPLPDTETDVVFSCVMPDQNGKDEYGDFLVTGAPRVETDNHEFILKIGAGTTPVIKGFRCIFKGYTAIPQTNLDPTFGILSTGDKKINPIDHTTVFRNIKLHAEYKDFRQKTSFDMFTADSSLADKYTDLSSTFQSQWKNSDGTVQSKCLKGCGLTKVDIVSIDPQPFLYSAEDIQKGTNDKYGYVYGLSVKIIGLTDFTGQIKKINSMEIIKKPDNIQFIGDGPFTYSTLITEDSPELTRINNKINGSNYVVAELRNDFVVTSATEMPTSQSLDLVTVFNYEFEKTEAVTITLDDSVKTPGTPTTPPPSPTNPT